MVLNKSIKSDLNRARLFVQNSLSYLYHMKDSQEIHFSQSPSAPLQSSEGGMGRRYLISYEQLKFFIENHFSAPQIANILHVSVRTIFRRMAMFSLSIRSQYSNINDPELDNIVCEIQREFPSCGNRQMHGHLLSRGLRVQQFRIRELQRRIDPDGCAIRQLQTIRRRQYSVPSPRALYHIDGNHKLIRYNYCIVNLAITIK